MTDKTRELLKGWAKAALIALLPLVGWAALKYDASLVHQSEYRLRRQADSTALDRIDRRTLKMLCHNNPLDSECP